MLISSLVFLASSLVINEVLYDPPGADSGREFVELFNADSTSIAWSTLSLEVGDGAHPGSWRRVWVHGEGTLAAGALWVLGGDGVPEASGRLTGALQNGPDAIRLLQDGVVIDLVGYGNLSDAGLYESSPAQDVSSQSLARIPDGHDTQNNSIDLQAHQPSPGRRNQPQREWQLRILEPPWHRFWPNRHIRVEALLRNTGVSTTTPTDWQLQAHLQHLHETVDGFRIPPGEPIPLEMQRLPASLAAGDSTTFEVSWIGERGLFSLTVQSMGADEWDGDNQDELLGRVGSGAVVINEILYAPLAGLPEWIELWNRAAAPVDLNGWTLQDASGRAATLHADGFLDADHFAVLHEDPQAPSAGVGMDLLAVTARPWPGLNNSDNEQGIADILTLRNAAGLMQDAVFYSGGKTVRGRSLERVHADADVRGVLWGLSKDPQGATPGRANSIAGGIESVGTVHVQPNPITPDGDGIGDVLHIQLQVPDGQEGFRARLFDLEGRLRRDIAGDRLGPGERNLVWDGCDESGSLVEMGVYLIQFEFFDRSSGSQSLMQTVGVVAP